MALIKDKIKSAENKELLKNPLVRGMLNTIRYAEGTAGEEGYNTRVGGGKFSDLSKKPGKKVYIKSINDYSSAEGAYQFLDNTYHAVAKDLGLTDFSPESQDLAAVELIKRRGALNDVLSGNFEIAVNKLSPEWASLPKSDGKGTYKNQKVRSIEQLKNVFYKNVDVNNSVKPYINTPEEQTYIIDTPETSNFVEPIKIDNLAESKETEAVTKAKAELDNKQQYQNYVQSLITASQVQYVDPNQVQQQEQYFQKGGKVNLPSNYDLPMNNPDILTPENFIVDYINSPKYKERLVNSGYNNPDKVIEDRLNSVKNVNTVIQKEEPGVFKQMWFKLTDMPYTTIGSAYQGKSNTIIIDENDKTKKALKGIGLDAIKAHEFGHTELQGSDINRKDEDELFNRQKDYKIGQEEDFSFKEREDMKAKGRNSEFINVGHDHRPEELKSDLNALRYLLKKENIYDAGKETFTKDHLNKLKSNFYKDRLLKIYNDKDLIWLMNNVAQNNENNEAFYAQNGGVVKDDDGYWNPNNWGKVVEINSPSITMQGVSQPLIGVSNETGETKLMFPNQNYNFANTQKVTEYPLKRTKNKRFS